MNNFLGNDSSYEVIHRLEKAGFEAVFVGGAVRDFVLGRKAKDIDIATSAEPTEVKKVFSNTVDVGLAHGTVLVIVNGEPIEVTTYRTEGTYTDHRRPDDVQFVKSLREDLRRRDFTINALAMTKDGVLIDPFEGQVDMKNRIIRAVGNPTDRFNEDALRMLRAIRFSSVLNFDIENETLNAIKKNAKQIRFVSIERLKIELDKLFTGVNPVQAFRYLLESGLDSYLPLFSIEIDSLKRAVPFETAIEGWAFITVVGNYLPSKMVRAYKLSKVEGKFIKAVDEAFDIRIIRHFTINDYYAYDLAVLLMAEKIFRSTYPTKPTVSDLEIKRMKQSLPIQSLAELGVKGSDLINWTGLKGGEWLGDWLKRIEDAVLHGKCENDPNKIREWFLNEFNR